MLKQFKQMLVKMSVILTIFTFLLKSRGKTLSPDFLAKEGIDLQKAYQ
jgi:hypothetical protein